jgi:hypothetical protein
VSALPESDFKALDGTTSTRQTPADQVALDAAPAEDIAELSPTTSIFKVLLTIGVALLLGLILNARSIVHDAAGMPDGIMRNATLYVGDKALSVADATHLTWPRDQLDSALGNAAQPDIPPLLQVGAFNTPGPANATPVDNPTSAVHVIAMISTPTPANTATPIPPTLTNTPVPPTPTATPRPTEQPSACHQAGKLVKCGTTTPNSLSCRGGRQKLYCPTPIPTETATARPPTATQTNTPIPPTPTITPTATATAGPPPRVITHAEPLRLLVTGDSLTGYIGPELIDKATVAGPVHGFVDTHHGTRLTRPDFVDWSLVAQQQVAADHPDAVVVMIGGNDFQNMTLPGGQFFTAGTPAWTAEYQRRAEICMRIWAQGGTKRVYWLSMPPARNRDWAHDDAQINIALQRAADDVPGAKFVNVLGPVTDHGKYVDFIHWHGQWVLIRENDGVHLNPAGSTIVAGEVLNVIVREWHLSW